VAAEALDVSADVLVIGGGPAGAWAAIAAAEAGARVILVDKGYLGTSGATAPSNTGTGSSMRKAGAEKYRDIDFSRANRGPVVRSEPGKTKISIRLDNAVLDHFKNLVDEAGALWAL
jgi:flavin-dependent dehydrogenase